MANEYRAVVISVFRNGDTTFSQRKITIGPAALRNWETVLKEMTVGMRLAWQVGSVFTLDGKKITRVTDLESGGTYVAGSRGSRFKKLNYDGLENARTQLQSGGGLRASSLNYVIKPGEHAATISAQHRFNRYNTPVVIRVYKNKEYSPARKFVFKSKELESWSAITQHLSSCLKMKTGGVDKVYEWPSGRTVRSGHDFKTGGEYVAVSHYQRVNLDFPYGELQQGHPPPRTSTRRSSAGGAFTEDYLDHTRRSDVSIKNERQPDEEENQDEAMSDHDDDRALPVKTSVKSSVKSSAKGSVKSSTKSQVKFRGEVEDAMPAEQSSKTQPSQAGGDSNLSNDTLDMGAKTERSLTGHDPTPPYLTPPDHHGTDSEDEMSGHKSSPRSGASKASTKKSSMEELTDNIISKSTSDYETSS